QEIRGYTLAADRDMKAYAAKKAGLITASPSKERKLQGPKILSRFLAAHDLSALNAFGCVARVDHKVRLSHNLPIIVRRMVCHDDDCVILAKIFQRCVFH